ncbi:DUF5681 domain-containing protein [Sphingomonas jaspsi]|uniref:DUF5681 domain-containing protein n=1 Tax=Sphingomonas jaspsi TaxID=392409 RepID=UPI0004B09FDC|nr:DUF5681 domain-containing protein [Sphingomonas jaspsi]
MADPEQEDGPAAVGYRNPPRSTRFRKGVSGNARGRPKARRKELPYDHVLGQMVTIREDGRERRITAAEAFLLHLTKKGLEGDQAAARASLAALDTAKRGRQEETDTITKIVWRSVSPGSVGCSLDALGMAVKLRKYTDNAEYRLKGWLVEAALKRLGDRQLMIHEQREVWAATHKPNTVDWPEWWSVRG